MESSSFCVCWVQVENTDSTVWGLSARTVTLTALELQCRILLPHPTLTKSIFSASEDKTRVQKQCNVYYLCLHLGDHRRAMEGQDEGGNDGAHHWTPSWPRTDGARSQLWVQGHIDVTNVATDRVYAEIEQHTSTPTSNSIYYIFYYIRV